MSFYKKREARPSLEISIEKGYDSDGQVIRIDQFESDPDTETKSIVLALDEAELLCGWIQEAIRVVKKNLEQKTLTQETCKA